MRGNLFVICCGGRVGFQVGHISYEYSASCANYLLKLTFKYLKKNENCITVDFRLTFAMGRELMPVTTSAVSSSIPKPRVVPILKLRVSWINLIIKNF